VGGDGGPIFTSADSGVTWVSNNVPALPFQFLASSADGAVLIAVPDFGRPGNNPGPIYTSTTFGNTWVSNTLSGVFWQGAAVSKDGKKWFVAGVDAPFLSPTGKVYVSPPQVILAGIISGGSRIVSWTTNANGFALEQSPSLAVPNWVTVTNVPTITNGNYEVILEGPNDDLLRLKK
jgi:hypothetical protein